MPVVKERGGLKTLWYKYGLTLLIVQTLLPISILFLRYVLNRDINHFSVTFSNAIIIFAWLMLVPSILKWIRFSIHAYLYIKANTSSEFREENYGLVYQSGLHERGRYIQVRDYRLDRINRKQYLFEIDDYTTGRVIHFIIDVEDKPTLESMLTKQLVNLSR